MHTHPVRCRGFLTPFDVCDFARCLERVLDTSQVSANKSALCVTLLPMPAYRALGVSLSVLKLVCSLL